MNWILFIFSGFALGLATFGALWLTVRQYVYRPRRGSLLIVGSLARLFLVGVVFVVLSRQGPDKILAALVGIWLARQILVHKLAGVGDAR